MRKKIGKFLMIFGIICAIGVVIDFVIFNIQIIMINTNLSLSHPIYGSSVSFWEWLSFAFDYFVQFLLCLSTIVLGKLCIDYENLGDYIVRNNCKLDKTNKALNTEITQLKSETSKLKLIINELEETISKKANNKKDA